MLNALFSTRRNTVITIVVLVIVIGLTVGLSVGLTVGRSGSSGSSSGNSGIAQPTLFPGVITPAQLSDMIDNANNCEVLTTLLVLARQLLDNLNISRAQAKMAVMKCVAAPLQ